MISMTKKDKWVDVTDEDLWYWKTGFTTKLKTEQVMSRIFRRVVRHKGPKRWKLMKLKEETK